MSFCKFAVLPCSSVVRCVAAAALLFVVFSGRSFGQQTTALTSKVTATRSAIQPTSQNRDLGHSSTITFAEWADAKSGGRVRLGSRAADASVRSYDDKGRLTKVLEPDANNQPTIETDYAYDDHGNLVLITQHGQLGDAPRVRSFTYDADSHLISATNPETGTITYTYNPDGKVASRTDARGITTHYSWDGAGRLTGKQYSDGSPRVVYVYGGDGSQKLIGSYLETPEGRKAERAYHYNPQGQVDQIIQLGQSTYTVYLGYDTNGRLNQITYPDGRIVEQAWNQTGQISSISEVKGRAYFSGATYWPSGELETAQLGNGVTLNTNYNNQQRLSALTVKQGNKLVLSNSYAYTNSGSISGITDNLQPSKNFAYSYDNLNRIQAATQPESRFDQDFRYDAFSNLQQEDEFPFLPAYDANNRVDTLAGLSYDPAGEMTFDGTHHYKYNAEGHIVDVDNGTVEYLYSAEGDRVKKNIAGAVTEEVWLGDELLAEHNPDGSWTDYIYANGQRIARAQGVNSTYYVVDKLGMTRMELSVTGEVITAGQFAPFGQQLREDAAGLLASVPFTGGEQHDIETGLDSYKYRSYNSVLGRWMSPDPSGEHYANLNNPQSLNLYAYVVNDPLKFVDSRGLIVRDPPKSGDGGGNGGGGGDGGDDGGWGDDPPSPNPTPDPGPGEDPTGGGGGPHGGSLTITKLICTALANEKTNDAFTGALGTALGYVSPAALCVLLGGSEGALATATDGAGLILAPFAGAACGIAEASAVVQGVSTMTQGTITSVSIGQATRNWIKGHCPTS